MKRTRSIKQLRLRRKRREAESLLAFAIARGWVDKISDDKYDARKFVALTRQFENSYNCDIL